MPRGGVRKAVKKEIVKCLRVTPNELIEIKNICSKYNMTEQELFSTGYKMYINTLKQK